MNVQELIAEACDEIKEMLLDKNRKYGNSALKPVRIFSKSDTIEQINVRIDDKLSRARNAQDDEDEDVESDLIGYLILKKVARQLPEEFFEDEEDDRPEFDFMRFLKEIEEMAYPNIPMPYPNTYPNPWTTPIHPPYEVWNECNTIRQQPQTTTVRKGPFVWKEHWGGPKDGEFIPQDWDGIENARLIRDALREFDGIDTKE